jgi:hypothetical protein
VTTDVLELGAAVEELGARGYPAIMQGVLHGGYEFALVDTRADAHVWFELMRLDAHALFAELKKLTPSRRYPV